MTAVPLFTNWLTNQPMDLGTALSGTIPVTIGPQTIPINVYQESGETTRLGRMVFSASDPGAHTGFEHYAFAIDSRPVGSGTNGPANADYGLVVSNLKHNFGTTSVVGEVDGIISVTRQGGTGSDTSAYLANVAHYGTGNASAFEGEVSIVVSNVITMQVDSQVGLFNNVTSNFHGFHTEAQVGSLGAAYHADSVGGVGTWAYLFQGLQGGTQVFSIDGGGNIAMTGGTQTITLNNSATTTPFLDLVQSGTGNAIMQWLITATRAWVAGIDHADSNAWKLGPNNDAFATAVLRIGTGGGMTVLPKLSIPAGGTAGDGIMVSSTANFGIFFGSGAPSLSAAQGSLYLRSDGAVNARLYINTNGAAGWTAFNTLA